MGEAEAGGVSHSCSATRAPISLLLKTLRLSGRQEGRREPQGVESAMTMLEGK